jgi:hypothetical protein
VLSIPRSDARHRPEAKVAASETYNTSLEQHLRDALGVRFAARPGADPSKRPIREIVGVDPRLNQRWSTRRANINLRSGELAIQFQNVHGRPPTPVEALHLAQQATLETRDAKHEPRPLAEQRTTWMNQASAVLGGRNAVASMVCDGTDPAAETPRLADAYRVAQTAARVLAAMEEIRSTWQMWHVRAEAQRHLRTGDMRAEQANTLVDLLVDEVLQHRCVARAASPDGIEEPGALRRPDGSSVYSSPAPTATPPSASSTPSNASSPSPASATERPSTAPWLIWPRWRWGRTALPWIRGKPPWSGRCAPRVLGCSWRSPRRRREDHGHARPHPSLDRRRRPGHRPRPVRCRRCSPR